MALRRANPADGVRISALALRSWRTRVTQSTTVKKKVFIVKKSALDELPTYPQDLQRWVTPRGGLDLPADIYGEDVLFIDDGYDRKQLNVPGLLHLEVAVKWSQDHSTGAQDSATTSVFPAADSIPAPLAASPAVAPNVPRLWRY